MGRISRYSTLVLMTLAASFSGFAPGPQLTSGFALTSSQIASYEKEANDLFFKLIHPSVPKFSHSSFEGNPGLEHAKAITYSQEDEPYFFFTTCDLDPPPQDGFIKNKATMLSLLGKLAPQTSYTAINISTSRGSTAAIGGAQCNGTVWDRHTYRERCNFCLNYLLTDKFMLPGCNGTKGYSTGIDLGKVVNPNALVNCTVSFSIAT